NYNIKKFSKNMLFDEKLGGTIHLAMGLGLEKPVAKTHPVYIGTCSVIWQKVRSLSMGNFFIRTANQLSSKQNQKAPHGCGAF
ncbi:MAG TPA: hypothetical protein VJ987_01740, partial [Anaerolineales bacterium]|nr:hypothetical protein [Anaerolineales bacterium]